MNRDDFMVLICAIRFYLNDNTDVDSSKSKSLAVDSLLAAAAATNLSDSGRLA